MAFTFRHFLSGAIVIASFLIPGLTPILQSLMLGLGLALMPSPEMPGIGLDNRNRAMQINRASGVAAIPVVYGIAKLSVCLTDVRVDEASQDDKDLWVVAAICHGSSNGEPIEDWLECYLDDRLAVNPDGSITSEFSGKLTCYRFPGRDIGGTAAQLNTLFPDAWPVTSLGKSVAHYVFKMTKDNDVYPRGGVPNITTRIKGVQVEDQRARSSSSTTFTAATGTDGLAWDLSEAAIGMRVVTSDGKYGTITDIDDPNDEITVNAWTGGTPANGSVMRIWKYSDNAALCIRDYLTSELYGCGVPLDEIDDDSFDVEADFCDVLVSIPDGEGGSTTQKRFTLNGVVDTARDPWEENLPELLTSCRGQILNEGGKFRLHIPKDTEPETFELNEDNIIGDWEVSLGGIGNVANVMRAVFVDADKEYQSNQVQWPEPGASNAYLTADNNFLSDHEIELPFTNNCYMAEQIAQVVLNESRQNISCMVTVKEEARVLQSGDVVNVNHATPAWTDKEFWVVAMFLLMDGNVRIALREYDDSAYSYDTMSDADSLPDTGLPDPFTVLDPTGLTPTSTVNEALETNSGLIPRCKLSWTLPSHPFLEYTEVYAKLSSASEWDTFPPVPVDDDQELYIIVGAGEDWDFRIRCVNTLGCQSGYVSQVNQTMYDPDGYDPSTGDPPDDPSAVVLTATVETTRVEG